MAQQPVTQYFRKPYQDLGGGLCSRPDPQNVPGNKWTRLDNAILADHDILEKAPGYALDGSPFPNVADSFIRMLVWYRIGTSTNSLVCAAQDDGNTNASYKVDFKQTFGDGNYSYIGYTVGTATFTNGSNSVTGSGTSWSTNIKAGDKIKPNANTNWFEVQSVTNDTTIVLTSNYTDTTASNAAYMVRIILNLNFTPVGMVFNNKLVETNGSEEMMEFDNVTWTRITGFKTAFSTNASFLEKHKNRLFAATNTTLYWSKVNDETTWNAASLAPIFSQDNGNIVGIKSFANSMLIFKDNGLIYQVRGDFDQDVVGAPTYIVKLDVPDNLGIIAGKSVVINDDSQLYFLCETGVYSIDPWYLQFKKVSWDIGPNISNLIFKSNPTANKQFTYSTQAQWNTGTLVGTKINGSNQLTTYNDTVSIISNLQQSFNLGCVIDSSNNVHIVGASGSTPRYSAYYQFKSDGTLLTEYIQTLPLTPLGMALDVSSTGAVGVVSATLGTFGAFGAQYPINIFYSERVITGTATFTNGSNAVTGSGTFWQSAATPLTAGSIIKNAVDNSWATVSTVNSDTSITLTLPYTGTSSSGSQAYVSWSNKIQVGNANSLNSANVQYAYGLNIKFNSNDPRVVYHGVNDHAPFGGWVTRIGALYWSRSGGTWAGYAGGALADLAVSSTNGTSCVSMASSGTHIGISISPDLFQISYIESTDGGGTFNTIETFAADLSSSRAIQTAFDGAGHGITGYSSSSGVSKRNHSTTTTNIVYSSATSHASGYIFYSGNDYAFDNEGSGASSDETYIFLSSKNVKNSSLGTITGGYVAGGCFSNNGSIFASASYSSSAGIILIRRVSFTGTWTSAVTTDSSLSSWGTYIVTGETDNGATVLQQIALGTTSSVGAPATITSGTVVSTNNTLIYFRVTVTMTISQLVAPVIGSIVLNYIGAGIDGKTPYGFVYNNEMYMSCTQTGNSSNNTVLFRDRKGAWGFTFPAITQLARMNQSLYAGSSTNGNVYKLKIGLDYAGTAYTLTAISKEDMLGSLELRKEVSKVYVLYRVQASGTFTFSYRLDSYKTNGGSAWVDTVIDQTKMRSDLGGIEIPINAVCSSIQFKITQADAAVQIGLIGWNILYGTLTLR